jgi:hypothetical protein
MKRPLSTLVGVIALLGSGTASAASLTVNGWTLGENVTIAAGADTGTVNTAQLNLTLNGVNGYSYCVDLAQSIGQGTTGGWTALSPASNDAVIRAAWLVDTFQPEFSSLTHPAGNGYAYAVTRGTEIAALQVAVWEVLSDTPGNYDLFSGSFALASGGASMGVTTLARDFLMQLGSADLSSFTTNDIWAANGSYQDQLFVGPSNPIPEAHTLILYLCGAAVGVFAVGKRRTA